MTFGRSKGQKEHQIFLVNFIFQSVFEITEKNRVEDTEISSPSPGLAHAECGVFVSMHESKLGDVANPNPQCVLGFCCMTSEEV